MKLLHAFCFLVVWGAMVPQSSFAQSTTYPGDYRMCVEGNSDARKNMIAPGMPEIAKRLFQLTTDDRICDCIKKRAPTVATKDASDPMVGFFTVRAACMAEHFNKEFPANCPTLLGGALAEAGQTQVTAATIDKSCACATNKMRSEITPETLRQSDLEQYRYFNVLVEDKKNGTSKAKELRRPSPGAMERGLQGIQTCIKENIVDTQRGSK